MFSESVIEAVKFFGGLGGLASTAFLIYDRLFRNEPLAFLTAENYRATLRLQNVSRETIIIEEISITPPILALDRANDLQSAQQDKALLWYPSINDDKKMRVFIILKPSDERSFHFNRSADFENAGEEDTVRIRCKWRNTRRPLPFYRSVWLTVYVKDIRALRDAALANKV